MNIDCCIRLPFFPYRRSCTSNHYDLPIVISTKGFHGILKTIDRDGIFLQEIKEAIKTNGAKRVIFSGYSLGGAVASLALLQHGDALLAEGIDVRAITFGCPRLADNKDLHKLPKRLTTKIIHTYIEGHTPILILSTRQLIEFSLFHLTLTIHPYITLQVIRSHCR